MVKWMAFKAMEGDMADEPKTTEPGVFRKAIELVDGKESADLTEKSITAYSHGEIREGMKLARESNREARKHLVKEVKGCRLGIERPHAAGLCESHKNVGWR